MVILGVLLCLWTLAVPQRQVLADAPTQRKVLAGRQIEIFCFLMNLVGQRAHHRHSVMPVVVTETFVRDRVPTLLNQRGTAA